jgi:cytochrome c heme-lyase
MPSQANQAPAPGQTKVLPTDRAESSIPKAGTLGTWVYPSAQMVAFLMIICKF